MTSMVVFPDIHDQADDFKKIRYVLADVDIVILAGDMTKGRVEHLHRVLNSIEPYNEHILAVCGNMDTEQMNMWLAREGMSIHRRSEISDGIAFLGVGGALPFYGDYVFSEEEFEGFLADTLQGVPEHLPKILVSHQPPYGTKMDIIESGEHVGSKAVRTFIEREKPLICFTGHIHHATGIDKIGETFICNPGPFVKHYAYAEVENGEVKTLEIRPVEALDI